MDFEKFKTKLFFEVQALLSFFGFSMFLWKLADWLKLRFFYDSYSGIKEWALVFYHPFAANLLNYLVFAFGVGVFSLILYLIPEKYIYSLRDAMRKSNAIFGALLLLISGFLSLISAHMYYRTSAIFPAFALFVLPFAYFIPFRTISWRWGKKALWGIIAVMYLAVAYDPIRFCVGPVRLFNEYLELYSDTLVGGKYINNAKLLSDDKNFAGQMPLDEFVRRNSLEYSSQIMGRGQINHIGHMLNPINEYSLGRPFSDIFMQYGVGNTLLFKWTMDAFGGVSLQNYYKCYIFYPIYYALFLLMLVWLFKDVEYVFIGFSTVVFVHFFYTYLSLLIAPGIIPTIHFFDVFAFVTAFLYLRTKRVKWVLLSLSFVVLAILMNRQFGIMLAIAWVSAFAVYGKENSKGNGKLSWFALPLLILFSVFLLSSRMSGETASDMFRIYFSGLFSWFPGRVFIFLTIIYFAASYRIVLLLKDCSQPFKYLYIMCFVYVQGLLAYYYWAGLINHLPLILPFVVLQGLLLVGLLEARVLEADCLSGVIPAAKFLSSVAAVAFVCVGAVSFYFGPSGKKAVTANFKSHRCYNWGFSNAKAVSTINPVYFDEASGVINKYAREKGIYIISRYDSILPFLSGHYSMMPHFELNWFIIDDKKYSKVIDRFSTGKPEYIFVDSDITSVRRDPWEHLFPEWANDRGARFGRLDELRKIFLQVSVGYRLVEKGSLISVYKRISPEALPQISGR